jgi:hypothetical protein
MEKQIEAKKYLTAGVNRQENAPASGSTMCYMTKNK